jgi:hypothetical protein
MVEDNTCMIAPAHYMLELAKKILQLLQTLMYKRYCSYLEGNVVEGISTAAF